GAALDPVVWVFLAAEAVEVLAGEPLLHATLLYAVGAVLAGDAVRRRLLGVAPAPSGRGVPACRSRLPRALLVACLLLYAVAVGSFRRYTYPMTVAVGIPAAAAVVWAWRVPPRPVGARDRRMHSLGVAL